MKEKKEKEIRISENLLPAMYLGFEVIDPPEVNTEDLKITKQNLKEKGFLHPDLPPFEEIVSLLRHYKEKSESFGQISVAYEGILSGPHIKHRRSAGKEIINLHIIGSEQSSADAVMIKTVETILKNAGNKNICFHINNVGGKTSQSQFVKESTNYYRKNIAELHTNARQLFKESIYQLVTKGKSYNKEIHDNAPKTLDFLDDDSRKHFSEVLEYMENSDVFYEIDNSSLGDPNYSSHTTFEVLNEETGEVLAAGTRYDLIGRKLGIRKDVPAICAMINIKSEKKISQKTINKINENKFFLVQVGYAAKIKALNVISKMAEAGIVIQHGLYRDKISAQLQLSKKINSSFLLIIGHKEALENSVIVRDADGRAQKTVKFEDLAAYLKDL